MTPFFSDPTHVLAAPSDAARESYAPKTRPKLPQSGKATRVRKNRKNHEKITAVYPASPPTQRAQSRIHRSTHDKVMAQKHAGVGLVTQVRFATHRATPFCPNFLQPTMRNDTNGTQNAPIKSRKNTHPMRNAMGNTMQFSDSASEHSPQSYTQKTCCGKMWEG
jgi:hypothetical protein